MNQPKPKPTTPRPPVTPGGRPIKVTLANGRTFEINEESANDDWAMVELFRWQYGGLPGTNDMRSLDIRKGLEGMAKAFQPGNQEQWPSPINIAIVLKFCARHMPEKVR